MFVGTAPRSDMERHPAVWINCGDRFEPEPVDHWGTHCAVPWGDGVVVCDVGPRLGETAWWTRPGQPSVNLGAYGVAAADTDTLVLLDKDHLLVNGKRIDLPRNARLVAVAGDTIYAMACGCSTTTEPRPDDRADMILTRTDNWTISDAPNDVATCTSQASYLTDGRILTMFRGRDGTAGIGHIY